MKKIKKIIYEDAPKESDSGLVAKVIILVGDEAEINEVYWGQFPFKAVVPYETPCTNIGHSVLTIQEVVKQQCEDYLAAFINGLPPENV